MGKPMVRVRPGVGPFPALESKGFIIRRSNLDVDVKFPTYLGPWYRVDLAADLTDSGINLANQSGSARIVMPWPGSVIGIGVWGSLARTGGSATFKPAISGVVVDSPTAVLNATDTQEAHSTLAVGSQPFVAGDPISATVTTTSDWSPTTTDVTVEIYVHFHE